MKTFYLSFADPRKWRNKLQWKWLESKEWKSLREHILARDGFKCVYCGYHSEKYQIVDHIDADPENNSDSNLQTICQMCNLIKHSGQGCIILGIVDLYKVSDYTQNEIMRVTHNMRDNGAADSRIIRHLGLEGKARFRQDMEYLKGLYGFVTSRQSQNKEDMYSRWLEYHKSHYNSIVHNKFQVKLQKRNDDHI